MKIALCPTNPTIGDLDANAEAMVEAAESLDSADLYSFGELAICGYPPRDLLLRGGFVEACEKAAAGLGEQLAERVSPSAVFLIGTPVRTPTGVANTVRAFQGGELLATYMKRLLPTYDVFDEDRYFVAGEEPCVIEVAGRRVGLAICEDLWRGEDSAQSARYAGKPCPVTQTIEAGAEFVVVASASPFVEGKHTRHIEILRHHAKTHGVPVASVNQIGGNDDLVFDGDARVVLPSGETLASNLRFTGQAVVVEVPIGDTVGSAVTQPHLQTQSETKPDDLVDLFEALVLGVRDYAGKSGFVTGCLGLSGGIDSALTAVIAARAMGASNLTGVAMPSRYSSEHSVEDAAALAERLGMEFTIAPIAAAYEGAWSVIGPAFGDLGIGEPGLGLGDGPGDLTDQNMQSRLRGLIMMALSNRTGALLLTTGNKSEYAVGYCTLYGDMNGGLAVLIDVLKTRVYELARAINDRPRDFGFESTVIPERTITKPPSAELAPDQFDSDSLPEYDVLDRIIRLRVDQKLDDEAVVAQAKTDEATTRRMLRMIDLNEYKRWQAAVGIKVSPAAFGPGRRMPIVMRALRPTRVE